MENTTTDEQQSSAQKTSPALNVMCGICFEFYNTSDRVFTTICGHLFHDHCLYAALRNSNTCPECRRPCSRNRIHPIFLNYGERTELDDQLDASNKEQNLNIPIWTPLFELEQRGSTSAPLAPPRSDESIECGTDPDGNPTYVARVYYQDDLLPASYVPAKGLVKASHGCHELNLSQDVELVNNFRHDWMADSEGHVPPNAIVAGYSELGENLYIGRTKYMGITLLGKIHPSHRVMYMPYKGKEVNSRNYEVLVLIKEAENTNRDTSAE